jgi:hypothetical protein
MNGKGDSPRPVNRERFESNFDEIQWNDRSKSDCEGCQVGCGNFKKTGLVCFPVKIQQESQQICVRKEGEESDQDQG